MPREQKEITSVRYSFYLPCAVVKTETQKPTILERAVFCRRQISRLPLSPEQVTLQAPSVSACSLQTFAVSLRSTPLLLCVQHSGHPPVVYRRWPPPFGVTQCPHIQHIGVSCQEKLRVFPKKVEPLLAQLFWDNPREHREDMVAQQNTLNRLSSKWYRSARWKSGLPDFADAPLR
jgi:hypothetical protein